MTWKMQSKNLNPWQIPLQTRHVSHVWSSSRPSSDQRGRGAEILWPSAVNGAICGALQRLFCCMKILPILPLIWCAQPHDLLCLPWGKCLVTCTRPTKQPFLWLEESHSDVLMGSAEPLAITLHLKLTLGAKACRSIYLFCLNSSKTFWLGPGCQDVMHSVVGLMWHVTQTEAIVHFPLFVLQLFP